MSDKLVKFLVVIFLTLLIWTWAYKSQEETETKPGTLEVASTTDPSLFVMFIWNENIVDKVPLTSLTFSGSPTKIAELRSRYRAPLDDPERERLEYYYNPQEYGQTDSRIYTIDMLDFLQKHSKTRDLALTLESCKPERVEVKVEVLEKKRLSIECRDENNLPVKGVQIEPAQVEMYVRKEYQGPAYVTLTSPLKETAQRQQHVRLTPYVDLAPGQRREATRPVSVTLEKADTRTPHAFKAERIGFVLSQDIQEKVHLKLRNEERLRETISVMATDEAFERYRAQPYHILIEISKNDMTLTTEEYLLKDIIYNFPQSDVSSGEIELLESVSERKAEVEIIRQSEPVP